MNVNLLYFASIKESLNCESENVEVNADAKVGDLIQQLVERGEQWQQTLQDSKVLIAVNQTISSLDTTLNPEDEVAFFPPVTGG